MEIAQLSPAAWMALLGGAFIAISCTLNLLLNGRITGMSSMTYTLFNWDLKEGLTWKYIFLIGMLTPVYILYLVSNNEGKINVHPLFYKGYYNIWSLLIGGVLVGLGTKIGNGCTSGHAVCGIARLSKRSIVATGLFLILGLCAGTLFTSQNWLRTPSDWNNYKDDIFQYISYILVGILFFGAVAVAIREYREKTESKTLADIGLSYIIGMFFGGGLAVSGMCNPQKIIGFLSIQDGWDLSLIFVMVSAIGINLIAFQLILKFMEKPIFQGKWPTSKNEFDIPVIIGPLIFGLGWGISGLCPGPGILNLFLLPQGFLFVFALACGQLLAGKIILPFLNPPSAAVAESKQNLTK